MGVAARVAKAAVYRIKTGYGLDTRELKRMQRIAQEQAWATRASSSAGSPAASLGASDQRLVGDALTQIADQTDMFIASLASARHLRMAEKRVYLHGHAVTTIAFHEWLRTTGITVVQDLCGPLSLDVLPASLAGTPCSLHPIVRWDHNAKTTTEMCKAEYQGYHRTGLAQAMLLGWMIQHEPIYHARCLPLPM